VRALRRAGRGGRPRLPAAAPLGHDRHHQRRRVRPAGPRLLAAPSVGRCGRGGGEPRLRGRGRAGRQATARSRRAAPVRFVQGRRFGRRRHHLRTCPGRRGHGRRARLLHPRRRVRLVLRPARPRRQDRRPAPLRPADPRRPAGHGKDRARHQDRLRRRPRPGAGSAGEGAEHGAQGRRRPVLARNERRSARHPPFVRRVAHLRRPHPPRRHLPAGLRPLRGGEPGDVHHPHRHRRHPGHHHLRPPHPLPPPEAHARAGAGGGGLPPAHAPRGGDAAGKPGVGDLHDHPGPQGHRQGVGGPGDRPQPALPRGGAARGQAPAALGPPRIRLHRAGRRHGHVRVPRRLLPRPAPAQGAGLRRRRQIPGRHAEVANRHGAGAQQGGTHHRQAAPRPYRRHPPVLRGRVHPLRRPRPSACGARRLL
ncbi:MAG: Replicative DNA helicase (DnaB), partial [uncultured Acetobacteraceae bacterium]